MRVFYPKSKSPRPCLKIPKDGKIGTVIMASLVIKLTRKKSFFDSAVLTNF